MDLVKTTISEISKSMPEHGEMLEIINKGLPEITRATSLFNKSQSQFMDNMLTVSKPTPIRNLRQILAEMNKARGALEESYYTCKKRQIEIRIKHRDAEIESDELKKEMLFLEAEEIQSQLKRTEGSISGAIRKLANYQIQYDSILSSLGITDFNEIDFEKEEESYHIMTAFEQGLSAARSHAGVIDEGNMIYFTNIGVNGTVAQKEVSAYFTAEQNLLKKGHEPAYEMQLKFLSIMAKKFEGCSRQLAEHKGMTTFSAEAALETGDMRLLNV